MERRSIIRIITSVVLLILLYSQGVSLAGIVFIGAFAIAFMLLRGRIYKKIENALEKWFSKTKRWKPWARKIVIFILFLAVLIIIKQLIFFLLKLVGFDIRQMMLDSMQFK